MQKRTGADPKVPPELRRLARASTLAPRPLRLTRSQAPHAPWTPRTGEARTLLLSLYFRPPGEAGTAGSAGGAKAGEEEAPPLARSGGAFRDPEPDRSWTGATEGFPRTPPPMPNRSHLYAQHRCRRRSRRGLPYPPSPRTSAAASAGSCAVAVFTARNQRNATVSQRFSERMLSFCDLVFACTLNFCLLTLIRSHGGLSAVSIFISEDSQQEWDCPLYGCRWSGRCLVCSPEGPLGPC